MKLKTYPKRIINQSVQGTYLNGYYNSVNYTLTFDDYKATGLKEIECTLERVEISPLTQKQTNNNKYIILVYIIDLGIPIPMLVFIKAFRILACIHIIILLAFAS